MSRLAPASTLSRMVPALALIAVGCSVFQPAEVADWEPAPGQILTSDTQTIEILVHERACASGASADGRIQEPAVEYQQSAVIVTIKVKPKIGGQDCPDNPLTPFTLELEEPLGDRPLLLGGRGEPRTPDADR